MRFKSMMHDDRGDSLVGVAISLALWALGFAMIALAVSSNMESTTTSVNFGMAANTADATIKKARVISWDEIGTSSASEAGMLPAGYTPVTTGTMLATETATMRGVPMTVKTSVGALGSGGYGAKMVAVKVTWQNYPSGKSHTITQSAILSPPMNESSPTSIPMLGE